MASSYKDGYLETIGDHIWLHIDSRISIPLYNHKDKSRVGSVYNVHMPDSLYEPNPTPRKVRYLINKPDLICF